jgi:hypothetical protein
VPILDDSDYEPKGQAAKDLAPEKLAKMDQGTLEDMRHKAPKDVQNKLGPYAHRAFGRAVAGEDKVGAAAVALYTPIYSAGKALGLIKTRSDASFEEMKQTYKGLYEGLRDGDPVANMMKGKKR